MTEDIRLKLRQIPPGYERLSLLHTKHTMNANQLTKIKDKLCQFCLSIPQNMTAHEKTSLLYNVVTKCIHYNHDERDMNLRFTYAGPMLTGFGVCMGIAELLNILLNACGIESRVVIGCITDTENYHAWIQVRLPDEQGHWTWYHADPTFDLLENGHSPCFYLKSDSYMLSHEHNWLPERYEPCPRNYAIPQTPNPLLVQRLCKEFQKMHSPYRQKYIEKRSDVDES